MHTAPLSVQVDWTRCDGHGLCAAVAPDVVTSDPWGYPLVRQGGPAPDPRSVARAVALCPSLALREGDR